MEREWFVIACIVIYLVVAWTVGDKALSIFKWTNIMLFPVGLMYFIYSAFAQNIWFSFENNALSLIVFTAVSSSVVFLFYQLEWFIYTRFPRMRWDGEPPSWRLSGAALVFVFMLWGYFFFRVLGLIDYLH